MTIRKRLVLVMALLLLLLLGSASVISYLEGRHEVEELFDAQLATSARVLQGLLAPRLQQLNSRGQPLLLQAELGSPQSTDTLAWLDVGEATDLGHKYEKKLAFQVWHAEGQLLARSASAPATALAPLTAGYATVAHTDEQGRRHLWRVFTLLAGEQRYQVAERDDVRGELAAYIAWQSIAVLLLVVPLLLLLLSLLLHRGLLPLEQLARLLRERGPHALTPINPGPLPGELQAISDSLNALFERLDRAFQRERQFAGNAAHELRTPLAALAIHAENALSAPDDEARRHSLAQMQAGLARTTRVVEQLLALARVEPMAAAGDWQLLSLAELLRQPCGLPAQQDGRVQFEIADAGLVRGNATLLQLALRNLVDNACRYSPPATMVRVQLGNDGGRVLVRVCDQGPGIAPEWRSRMLEPFVRGEGQAQPGSGLGLAIVRQIVELHQGQILLGDGAQGRGLCVSLWLPHA